MTINQPCRKSGDRQCDFWRAGHHIDPIKEAVIDLSAIEFNIEQIALTYSLIGQKWAVVKANNYGHGAISAYSAAYERFLCLILFDKPSNYELALLNPFLFWVFFIGSCAFSDSAADYLDGGQPSLAGGTLEPAG